MGGLKTGMYYLRSKAAANAIQFTVDQTKVSASKKVEKKNEAMKKQLFGGENLVKKVESGVKVGMGGDNMEKENQNPRVPGGNEVKSVEEEVGEVVDQVERVQLTEEDQARLLCSLENKEACMMCSG